MKNTQIGLPKTDSKQLAAQLNKLLANFQIHYQNLRGLHWNLRGRDFFELHVKYEEYYMIAQERVDVVAERILTLGFTPLHTFSAYLKESSIAPAENVTDGKTGVSTVVLDLQTLIGIEREVIKSADECGDDGTTDMMTQFIQAQEKDIWMLNAWLG